MRLFFFLASMTAVARPQDEVRRKAMDALFASFDGNAPGCAAGAALDGRTLHAAGYGMASLEHSQQLTPASSFYMASVSKQFMAMAILLLEEEGKLKTTDPVRRHLPELPAYTNGITIGHLLHHTSGLRDYLTLGVLAGYSPDHVWTEHAARAMIVRQKALNFEPGSEFLYSNSGYVMLSWIAGQAAGKRLDEWSGEKIFLPLGMTSTRWQHNHRGPVPGRATGHQRRNGAWQIANSMLDVVGDGGLYSTVEDMLRWNANFDRPRAGQAALARMQMLGTVSGPGPMRYGMGLFAGTYRGLATVSHGGALAGYRTHFLRFPEQKFGAVVLCNNATANPARFAEQIAEIWIGGQMREPAAPNAPKPAPPKPATKPLEPRQAPGLAGVYFSDELASTRIEDTGTRLDLSVAGLPASPLFEGAGGGLTIGTTGVSLTPRYDSERRVTGFTIEAGRVKGVEFTRH